MLIKSSRQKQRVRLKNLPILFLHLIYTGQFSSKQDFINFISWHSKADRNKWALNSLQQFVCKITYRTAAGTLFVKENVRSVVKRRQDCERGFCVDEAEIKNNNYFSAQGLVRSRMTRALPPIAVAHGFSFELLTFCKLDMSRNSFTDIIWLVWLCQKTRRVESLA